MELALNEINLAIDAGQKYICPAFFTKYYGRAVVSAAFRKADMRGYTKRGATWFRDEA